MKYWKLLHGNKTYIVGILFALMQLLKAFRPDLLTIEQEEAIYNIFAVIFGLTVGHKGVRKMTAKKPAPENQ